MDDGNDISDLLPLREPTFLILVSLADGPKHGYAILKNVEAASAGATTMSTGTLYEALARLLTQGLIARVAEAHGVHPGKPRKSYQLTTKGKRLVQAEIARLQALIAAAQQRLGSETAA